MLNDVDDKPALTPALSQREMGMKMKARCCDNSPKDESFLTSISSGSNGP